MPHTDYGAYQFNLQIVKRPGSSHRMGSITTTTTHQWDSKVHQPPVSGLEIWFLATYCFRTALTPVISRIPERTRYDVLSIR
ncbi:hypothetical protein FOTG_18128 [Fusarium oxysporum f. sp. vasinfectum 25433]|uniref:Uncharacterized protein n=1 Tax=Fusarium oxysporum f. sp. vasinfectum 25433 TaxID=1089449 RepID=X0KIT8_FUSOX|nr:hypothetical protein FOTG_18128 [Fusarium oxysporum f. sp. vasinfectum 25433]